MSIAVSKIKKRTLASWIPWPDPDANKYTRGKLVAVGGAAAYPGAICLASTAALRMGAGYVEVVCAPETLPTVHAYNPNLVARSWDGWTVAKSGLAKPDDGRHPQACLVGSGFDAADSSTQALVLDVLENCRHPVVVDGGALTTLATEQARALTEMRRAAGLPTIATPHFGEAARLAAPLGLALPKDPSKGRRENARFAQSLADSYGATVVLKGPDTYVATPAGSDSEARQNEVPVMTRGTAALAKAGTGDVLAGITSALVAQGLTPYRAANLAANLHAQAGRAAAESLTEISVCAEDLISRIPAAIGFYNG